MGDPTSDNRQKAVVNEDEIDLVELVRLLWSRRGFLLRVVVISAICGIVVVFTLKVEYQASCRLMPESQEGVDRNLGGLGGLAGLAGVSLDLGGGGSLTPDLYPEIVSGLPFQWRVLQEPVRYRRLDTTITTYTFLTHFDKRSLFEFIAEYTLGLPGKIKQIFIGQEIESSSSFQQEGLVELSREDWELVEELRERIRVSVDSKTGIINIVTENPDPYAAAQLAQITVNQLTEEITKYKIEKVRVNLEFVEERYQEAKNEYEKKQTNLAIYTDRNKNINSSLVQVEYQRLQNELDIAFEVYKSLASQLEQARIQVKEETPVFTVLEPVRVPVKKSKPKRLLIVLVLTLLGGMVATVTVLVRSKLGTSNGSEGF